MNYAGKFDATFSDDGSAAPSLKSIHIDHPPAHAPSDAILVPDAHFLFNADFKRSGVDLILSGDNRDLVLHDYFKGEKRAALASPDGAHLTGDVVTALTGHVEISQAGTNPASGQVIGHLTKLQGTATATRNGVSIILNNGDNVEKGDVIESGSNSTVGITFIDGTVFGLSSNARMVLNEMVYDPNGSNNSTLFNLVAGTISFVAGQTAKHGDMKIDTPVATMGIRGTAVLVQIDFSIPGQSGAPNASFQVLVEPDGTTGSYVLFDKTTLQPIATVNQAGQQININNGVISQSNAPLSPDVQKLIQDVFTQKFTDNSNTKQTSPFNDTLSPTQQGLFIKLADGSSAIANYVIVNAASDPAPQTTNGPSTTLQHIPGQPNVVVADLIGTVTTSFTAGEVAGQTGDVNLDVVQGVVRFADVNAGDQPTVKVNFSSFSYQNANHTNVTASLSPLQLADIAATQVSISVVADPGNKNTGSATWTYSIADKAFDFLAAGEQLTLTYMVRVDNNYAPANETKFVPITITITGTNDAPVFTSSSPTISFSGATSMSGGNLPSGDATSGALSFQDVDLTDTHTVSPPVLTDALLNGSELPQNERDLFANALTASIETDSTGTGNGVVEWKLADLSANLADFVPKGETLVLTYAITVTDSHGATATQTITIDISNPAEKWIATAAPDSASGGLWSVGENWATGAAPTANDDAIIITDQPNGLTPTFPVTVDAPAAAKSLVMNDFRGAGNFDGTIDSIVSATSDDLQPILINLSTLDIGAGGLSVSADAVIKNYGTITVAGATEFDAYSELLNSGMFKLGGGGKFADQTNITNTATGVIEVQGGTLDVAVGIANSGQINVDSGAVLALGSGTIDGGLLTVHGILELEGEAFLQGGSLTNLGKVEVSGSGNVLSGETVTNTVGQIDIGADPTSDLAQEPIATSNLALKNGTEILGGLLTIGIAGVLEISTAFGASLFGVDVDNAGVVEIDSGSLLALGQTTITGGTLTDLGTIHVTGDSAIDNAAITGGALIIDQGKTLYIGGTSFADATITVSGTLNASGISEIDGATICNTGVLEVTGGTLTIDAASHIDNKGIVEANGGNLIIDTGFSGKAEIGGTSTLELGADGKGAYSGLEIDFADHSSATLKLDHAESFTGQVSNLDDDDAIDLADIAFKPGATVSFSGDTNGGTLTITSNGEVSYIKLAGDYLGSSWSLADDGSGHVKLTEVPGVLSGLDSHNNAVEGKAITVSITDGGAAVTDPVYTFETSSNGTDWTTVQSGASNCYTPTEADEGKQLKVVMSFTDHEGNHDTSTISAGTVQEAPDAHPVILSETDPAAHTIILSESPIVLPQGTFDNSLGLNTENFDNTPADSHGFSHGDFFSSALDATFSASGPAGVFSGSLAGVSAAPFVGPLPGHQDTTHYLSIGANGAETISFASEQNAFGLYWGSVDPSNTIAFYNGDKLVASYSGTDISPLLASGGQGSFASNGYVEFKDLAPFDKVVLSSTTNSFELDNVSSGYISDSHIHLAEPITGTLTVHDDDIGDQLTGSVTGPAVIKYNGSTTLPAGINVDALINPSAVTFDSTTSDGKADTLHWTYNPSNYNLDFLEPGDTLTITFNAQVSDGHVSAGNQPLTITLTGAGSSVVNGTAQDDVFDHVGGGVTIFGHGGNDTFVFSANFGSATIGDFDPSHGMIDIDQSLFKDVSAILSSAQSVNSGHDTLITDANHDKILLTGLSPGDLKAHDFHLV